MRGLFTSPSVTIPAGQAVAGVASRTETLRVRTGRVWITVEGISHDYWLFAGDSFTAPPGRKIVVEADAGESHVESVPAAEWTAMLKLLLRDLATYLRQPAPDETLLEAAGHFMQREMPEPP